MSDDLGIEWLDQIELLLIIEDEFTGIKFSDLPAIERASAICSAT